MDAFSLGPLTITLTMLTGILAAASGLLIHTLAVRRMPEGPALGSLMLNALLVWLVAWKLSPVLFDPASYRGFLYWQGGTRGAWAATALAAAYLIYAGRRSGGPGLARTARSALIVALGALAARQLLVAVWGEGSSLTAGLLALLAAGLLALLLSRRATAAAAPDARAVRSPELQAVILLAAGYLLITTLGSSLWEERELAAAARSTGLGIGEQAPDFALTDLDGRPASLSDYRDKTVVLNFWATWCPPCRAEMPELQKFHEANLDTDIIVLAVNATDTESGAAAVRRWLSDHEYTMPVLADPRGEAGRLYRVRTYPTTYVIGPGGIVRGKHLGPMNRALLAEAAG